MRYLSKSRFKLGRECGNKLFYTGKAEYINNKEQDSFMEALAEGGFQIGELAKLHFPGGIEITERDSNKAAEETNRLLQKENVVLFEPAIIFKNLLIRVDILVKKGNDVELIEVKSASYSGVKDESLFNAKSDKVTSSYSAYVEDVAFQSYVFEHAFPDFSCTSYLMFANSDGVAEADGMNQWFKFTKDDKGRKKIIVHSEALNFNFKHSNLLKKVYAERAIALIHKEFEDAGSSFALTIDELSKAYSNDRFYGEDPGLACKSCEFKAASELSENGLKSGFHHCMKQLLNWENKDFSRPLIYDIWNFRKARELIEVQRLWFLDEIDIKQFDEPQNNDGMTSNFRRKLQIEKTLSNNHKAYIDKEGLSRQMSSWKYPLHMIDFETSMVAIPFFKGMKPYEGIAFQFSHHILHEDGRVEHKNQFLNAEPGVFPNFEFARALKKALEDDNGSIFKYSAHENTYLNHIARQLVNSNEPDKAELIAWLKTITRYKDLDNQEHIGERDMIDLLEVVKKYYYHPYMKGSNSIKKVLPAILQDSTFLKETYGKDNYGSSPELSSLNFRGFQWVRREEHGELMDPYSLLPKFEFLETNLEFSKFLVDNSLVEVNDGGAAMKAYQLIQFSEGITSISKPLKDALFRYCELDTLAMIMIVQEWRELLK